MKINIRGDKISVTDALREKIEEKMEKIEKYFDNPEEINANILIKVQNMSQIIEVTIPTSKFTLRAEESNLDLYTALDYVIDKLERQIRKNKTRLKNKYKEKIELRFDYDDNVEEINDNKIVKRKNIDSKPMDEEEAILQYELLDHDFFIFNNIDEGCTSVIYKRKDGNYGIVNIK